MSNFFSSMKRTPSSELLPETKTECSVCCNTLKSLQNIVCKNCDYNVCIKCYEKYIFSCSTIHCMHCQIHWDREQVSQIFGQDFVKTKYETYLSDLYFSVEKSKFDLYTPIVLELKQRSKKEKLSDLDRKKIVHRHLGIISKNEDTMKKTYGIHRYIQCEGCELKIEVDIVKTSGTETCENCKSIVCVRCDKFIKVKDNECVKNHVCKKDDVDTVELMKKDSKYCPLCKGPVMKVEGCPQVWVRCCKIAFDYNTGEIVRAGNVIHATDYWRYKREQKSSNASTSEAANQVDNPDICAPQEFIDQAFGKRLDQMADYVQRQIGHWLEEANKERRIVEEREPAAIAFILGEIKEDEFRKRNLEQYKDSERVKEICEIIDTFVQTGRDIIREFATNPKYRTEKLPTDKLPIYGNQVRCNQRWFAKSWVPMVQMINDRLQVVQKMYGTKTFDKFLDEVMVY